jgi:hypothetical protein
MAAGGGSYSFDAAQGPPAVFNRFFGTANPYEALNGRHVLLDSNERQGGGTWRCCSNNSASSYHRLQSDVVLTAHPSSAPQLGRLLRHRAEMQV